MFTDSATKRTALMKKERFEMIIFSQNKENIVNFDNASQAYLEEVVPFGEYRIVVSTNTRGSNISIGRYKDKDSAKYVLRQVMNCITKGKEFFFMPDYDGERSMDV